MNVNIMIVWACTAASKIPSLFLKTLPKTVGQFFSSTSFGDSNDKGQCTGSINGLVRVLKMKAD